MSNVLEESGSSFDLSSLLVNLLSNPETLSKMSNIISSLSANQNVINSPPNNNNEEDKEEITEDIKNTAPDNEASSPTFQNLDTANILSKMPEILSKISSVKTEDSIATKQQIALLFAIKPYLSEHRKELINTFIKINRLSSIFKNLT